ncbi:hypothetical protein YM3MPS_24850 [Mycobacterium pseudoshottsii]|nr:hypothetical protein BB170200_01046 [Mycobacterium marinum]BEH76679.1 hypothetical protein YM3MPS_24820 [Mycobacterium pseudoshottsii]BEH76682.1 hypothetical protein YM3MPS_24850 [Mycobacterium pseudoshottsii]
MKRAHSSPMTPTTAMRLWDRSTNNTGPSPALQ